MAQRIRIAHLTSVHHAFDARIFHRQCCSLARAGYDVVLVAPHRADEEVSGVRIWAVPPEKTRWKRRIRTVWQVYRRALADRFAAYQLHDPELIPIGWLLKYLHGRRVVFDMHEYYSQVIPVGIRNPTLRGAVALLIRLTLEWLPLRTLDGTVFPTAALRARFPERPRFVTLLNVPGRPPAEPEAPLDWGNKEFDLAFVGAVSPPRMGFMMEVLRRLAVAKPDVRWLFLGCPPRTVDWVKSTSHADLAAKHVVFVGRVPHVEVRSYLRRTRVGFCHHPRELRFEVAIPMKVFEYQEAGLPVVTTALPEVARLLKDGENVRLVHSNDPQDYAQAVLGLLSDPPAAEAMGRRGAELIRERLHWEAGEEGKLLEFYQQLVHG